MVTVRSCLSLQSVSVHNATNVTLTDEKITKTLPEAPSVRLIGRRLKSTAMSRKTA